MIKATPYLNVETSVISILEKESPYCELAKDLERLISEQYSSLHVWRNPVVTNLECMGVSDIEFILQEYSGFSNDSIHLFHDSLIRLQWSEVKAEVERNLSEEMGILTNGIPHLELMRVGYKQDLGVETENIAYTQCTEMLLSKMRKIFRTSDNAYLCGALLALEATATDEFKGVEIILRTLKRKIDGGVIPSDSLTGEYILGHVSESPDGSNPEDDHYAGMRDSIGKYINKDNSASFVRGFVATCTALNTWWESIAIQVFSRRLDRLAA
ncbi:DUF3865 domain-containing protein [Pseudomonas putida]|uniref:DUF3865 domain-containing protein n=1 Tax=Pseudomonas putida TaxID=303 RepID=UPI000370C111|nr:DUF3865 domain-containing protein [Pseudomonas putida]